jgi:FixJ family two-component response regulator
MNASLPIVHVIDDDPLIREGIERLLNACGYRAALYESASHFIDNAPTQERGCILLDARMPGLTGLELQERLRAVGSILPIVFLSAFKDIPTTVRAIKAGAEDFLSKPVSKDELFSAIDRALVRYDKVRATTARVNSEQDRVETLTPRERQVYALLIRGNPHKQIAYELGTTIRTVRAHRHSIMEKLKVRSLAEAVSIAEHVGIPGQAGGTEFSEVRHERR